MMAYTQKKRKKQRRLVNKDIDFRNRRRFDRRVDIEELKRVFSRSRQKRVSEKCRIVITGIGVLAPPDGIGKKQFWDNLAKGISGIRPISMFNADKYKTKLAGEVADINFPYYLGQKGLRLLDRSTKLINVAAKLALEDSGIEISEGNTYDTGVVVGTSMGSVRSISEFDKSSLLEGFSGSKPALFPNTVINSPASQAAIKYDIRGLNATISNGFCSALDAAIYAYDSIYLNKVSTVFAGAVEEFCHETFLGFYKAGCLAGSSTDLKELEHVTFDKRRKGLILGEGAGVLVIEELEHARERKAQIYGEILGFARNFDPQPRKRRHNLKADGPIKAMDLALKNSNLKPEDIDLICAGTNFTQTGDNGVDRSEMQAIEEVFSEKTGKPPVTAIKSLLGEGYSVSGIFQIMAGLLAINEGIIPPTINSGAGDPDSDYYVTDKKIKAKVANVMINSFSSHGNNTSLIIAKI